MQMRQKTATLGVEEDGGGFGKLAHPIASSVGAHLGHSSVAESHQQKCFGESVASLHAADRSDHSFRSVAPCWGKQWPHVLWDGRKGQSVVR